MAATLKDIQEMINSGKHRPQKRRALAMPTKAFDGDESHLKATNSSPKRKNIKLAMDILNHYRFPK